MRRITTYLSEAQEREARANALDIVTGKILVWRKLTADQYAEHFPAKPVCIRKLARAIRELGAAAGGPFTIDQWELAKQAGIGRRSVQRYVPVFEQWGILQVKRWRYAEIGTTPNTYLVFLGRGIPDNWEELDPPFRVSPREAA
jgi:hypothetical protein